MVAANLSATGYDQEWLVASSRRLKTSPALPKVVGVMGPQWSIWTQSSFSVALSLTGGNTCEFVCQDHMGRMWRRDMLGPWSGSVLQKHDRIDHAKWSCWLCLGACLEQVDAWPDQSHQGRGSRRRKQHRRLGCGRQRQRQGLDQRQRQSGGEVEIDRLSA